MSWWNVIHFAMTLGLGVGFAILWIRTHSRSQKDDPRLSRGLQLLQSKISILEDLSDRTDRQTQQTFQLIDQKNKLLQGKILEASTQMQKIELSMQKSLEVAEIFQDRIPHEKIIERQNTLKYVTAARMAHEGKTTQEIAQAVDLPASEISLIAKVNRDKLVFQENALPGWAQKQTATKIESTPSTPVRHADEPFIEMNEPIVPAQSYAAPATQPIQQQAQPVQPQQTQTTITRTLGIEKVQFPKVEVNPNKILF